MSRTAVTPHHHSKRAPMKWNILRQIVRFLWDPSHTEMTNMSFWTERSEMKNLTLKKERLRFLTCVRNGTWLLAFVNAVILGRGAPKTLLISERFVWDLSLAFEMTSMSFWRPQGRKNLLNRNIYRVKYFTVVLHDKGIPFEIPRRPTSLARNDRDVILNGMSMKWRILR